MKTYNISTLLKITTALGAALFLSASLSTAYAAGNGKGGGNGGGNGGGGGDGGSGGSGGGTDRIVFSDDYTVVKRVKGKETEIVKSGIFSMNPDGSGVEQLTIDTTSNYARDINPRWSPDRQHILFRRDGLHIMDAIGETYGGESFPVISGALGTGCDWSPDGTMICFPSSSPLGIGVVEVDPDTGWVGEPILVWDGGWAGWPSWSSDGSKIVFDGSHPDPNDPSTWNNYLTILDLQTGEETVWFDHYSPDIPQWSPDGSQIAFRAYTVETVTVGGESTEIFYDAIFTIDPDFTSYTRVTNSDTPNARYPAWSPDGTEIAFVDDTIIYKVSLATGETTQLGSCTSWLGYSLIDWSSQ